MSEREPQPNPAGEGPESAATNPPPDESAYPPPQYPPQAYQYPPPQNPAPAYQYPPPQYPPQAYQYPPPQYSGYAQYPPPQYPPQAYQYPPQQYPGPYYPYPQQYPGYVQYPPYPAPKPDGPGVALAKHPHIEPREHHRLLRTARARAWMPIVGTVFFIVAYVFSAAVLSLPFIFGALGAGYDDGLFPFDSPIFLLFNNLLLAVLIPISMLTVWLVHRERPGWLSSVARRFRWRLVWPFVGLALAAQFVTYLVTAVFADLDEVTQPLPQTPDVGTVLAFLVIIFLTTPLQAAAEEYAFRGYLSQAIGYFAKSWVIPAVITGLLFAAAHGSQDLAAFVDRFAFGMLASYVTWRSGGLEAASVYHAANNVVILALGAFVGNPLPDPGVQTSIPWSLVVFDILGMVVFGLLTHWYVRRAGLQRTSVTLAAPAPPVPPTAPPAAVPTG